MKLTLQRKEPYESFVSETWCPPELVPSVERMDKDFFESFLMDEFSEEVWDYFNTEFDDILSDMIGDISFAPKAGFSIQRKIRVQDIIGMIFGFVMTLQSTGKIEFPMRMIFS